MSASSVPLWRSAWEPKLALPFDPFLSFYKDYVSVSVCGGERGGVKTAGLGNYTMSTHSHMRMFRSIIREWNS